MSWTEIIFGPITLLMFLKSISAVGWALFCGAIVGYEREQRGRPAGLRSQMLVCLGVTGFILIPSIMGATEDSISRTVQGVGAFIGALALGTVIKVDNRHIIGITTAMTFAPTAAVGIAIGHSLNWLGLLFTVATWFTLRIPKAGEKSNDSVEES